MKATKQDIKWCIENREFVNGLLEKQGGPEQGDWFLCEDFALDKAVVNIASWEEAKEVHAELVAGGPGTVWLPTVGDVLAMLEDKGIERVVVFKASVSEGYFAGYSRPTEPTYYGLTRLIALLELLKVVEGKG